MDLTHPENWKCFILKNFVLLQSLINNKSICIIKIYCIAFKYRERTKPNFCDSIKKRPFNFRIQKKKKSLRMLWLLLVRCNHVLSFRLYCHQWGVTRTRSCCWWNFFFVIVGALWCMMRGAVFSGAGSLCIAVICLYESRKEGAISENLTRSCCWWNFFFVIVGAL